MGRFIIFCFVLCWTSNVFSQKPAIDSLALDRWSYPSDYHLSNDGRYIACKYGSGLIVQAVDNSWRREFSSGGSFSFTGNSQYGVFFLSKDTMCVLELAGNKLEKVPSVLSYKLSEESQEGWLAYDLKTEGGDLIYRNLDSGGQTLIKQCTNYLFNYYGNVLVVQSLLKGKFTLQSIDLDSNKVGVIWTDSIKATNIGVDNSGRQLAFITKCLKGGKGYNELLYYRQGSKKTQIRLSDSALKEGPTYGISDLRPISFSGDGKRLFFYISEKIHGTITGGDKASSVDVWSYKDKFLQSQQLSQIRYSRNILLCVVNLCDSGYALLESTVKKGNSDPNALVNQDYFIALSKVNYAEINWKESERPDIYLVSEIDGTNRMIAKHVYLYDSDVKMSRNGKYVLWFDRLRRSYFCYEISTGICRNISKQIPFPLFDKEDDHARPHPSFGIAGWMANDSAVLLYDKFDVWKVDPKGGIRPLNITNGYGRKHNIVLRVYSGKDFQPIRLDNDGWLLLAFDRSSKYNGFYRLKMGKQRLLSPLTMGPYIYCLPEMASLENAKVTNAIIMKAKDTSVFLLMRMSASEFPNLYITQDFKSFKGLTDFRPQTNYNWLSVELLHWKMLNQGIGQGILYKPENFDYRRKYPIIFYFYEKSADALNDFVLPEYCDGPLNIPYFVSAGYLVFVPDIIYEIGYPGKSAYNAVVSAALYLKQFPWIDGKRMGIQGHSFGGFEVNYIVTHSYLFSAAASAEGISDMVGFSNFLYGLTGQSNQDLTEDGQCRIGVPLWSKPTLYYMNSPVLFADYVKTPILIMENKADNVVSWQQGVEFFTALRRLGKRAWMLQYDHGEHQLTSDVDRKDYTVRLMQFFDHFLKNTPEPEWMSKGIPAVLKGVDRGF